MPAWCWKQCEGLLFWPYFAFPVFRLPGFMIAVAQWLTCCATNRKVAGSIPAGVIGIFHWHEILPIALRPWGRLSLQQKWVPGAFPGGKGGRCVRLTTLPPSCAVVMKSGNLNFLEPSGPLQACNGIALPLLLCFMITKPYFSPVNVVFSNQRFSNCSFTVDFGF